MSTIYVCNVGMSPPPLGMPSMVTENGRQPQPTHNQADGMPAPLGMPPSSLVENADNGRDKAKQGRQPNYAGQGGTPASGGDMPRPLGVPRW